MVQRDSKEKPCDFLARQLFTKHNIVTFRSLSRDLSLHVNQAKSELAAFHENERHNAKCPAATYLVCGEMASDAMQVDSGETPGGSTEDSDTVPQLRMVMVGETSLDNIKTQFSRITTVYIHSLSPSPLHDAGLLSEVNDRVREIDNTRSADFAKTVGRILCNDIMVTPRTKPTKNSAPVASSSTVPKPQAAQPSTSTTAPNPYKPPEKSAFKSIATEKGKGQQKGKQTGKLDFFAKPKAKEGSKDSSVNDKGKEKVQVQVQKTEKVGKPIKKSTATLFARPSLAEPVKEETPSTKIQSDMPKRGVKRKSGIDEEEQVKASTSSRKVEPSRGHTKNGVVLSSDDEEEEEEKSRSATLSQLKKRPAETKVESDDADLRAMMDVDDVEVDHVSRRDGVPASGGVSDGQSEPMDVDVDMEQNESDDDMIPVKRTRKTRKIVPKGKNGLPKKRVVKTRKTKDAKGYTVKEDYSSYESVDSSEDEAPPPPPPPPTKKEQVGKPQKAKKETSGKKATPVVKESSEKTVEEKSSSSTKKAKSAPTKKTGKPQQRNLASFFAKPKT